VRVHQVRARDGAAQLAHRLQVPDRRQAGGDLHRREVRAERGEAEQVIGRRGAAHLDAGAGRDQVRRQRADVRADPARARGEHLGHPAAVQGGVHRAILRGPVGAG
jgi:hypothetical protein